MSLNEKDANSNSHIISENTMKEVVQVLKVPYEAENSTLNLVVDKESKDIDSSSMRNNQGKLNYSIFKEKYNERMSEMLMKSGFLSEEN